MQFASDHIGTSNSACGMLLFHFLFHTVGKHAGVRISDLPNTEKSVFVLTESAISGAKFVYTKMCALWEVIKLQLHFNLELCTFTSSYLQKDAY